MDARSSRYHDVYAHWQRDPEGFWARSRRGDRLVREAEEDLRQGRRHLRPLVHRRHCNTCYNAARPPRARRPQRPGRADLRFPRHQHQCRPSPTAACCPRCNCSAPCCATSASRRATSSSSTCRWCRKRCSPCWPARASAPSIRWCSAASRPRNSPPASTTAKPKVILSASCGIEGARVIPYKPLLDEAIKLAKHKPDTCLILQRPQCEAHAHRRPRPRLAQGVGARGQLRQDLRMRAGRRHRSALHSLHLGHDRHSERRGARQWRPHGRAQMVDAKSLRRRSGRSVVVGLRRRLGGRPLLHRLCAAVPRLHLDPVRGQAGRHARRRRVLARLRRARRGVAVHRADRVPRHPQGRPGRQAARAIRPDEIPHAVPGRRARRPADHPVGRGAC